VAYDLGRLISPGFILGYIAVSFVLETNQNVKMLRLSCQQAGLNFLRGMTKEIPYRRKRSRRYFVGVEQEWIHQAVYLLSRRQSASYSRRIQLSRPNVRNVAYAKLTKSQHSASQILDPMSFDAKHSAMDAVLRPVLSKFRCATQNRGCGVT
jgi:hypothetical protein